MVHRAPMFTTMWGPSGIVVGLVTLAALGSPAIASASSACTWDEASATLTVREDGASLALPDPKWALPCSNAEGGSLPAPGAAKVIRVQFTGVETSRVVRLAPPRYAGVSIAVDALPEGASGDLTFELAYDDAQEAPYYLAAPKVSASGIDLAGDGSIDVSVGAGQNYTVDIRSTRQGLSDSLCK